MLLLDTNIVSYLLKGDPRVDPYRPEVRRNELAVSCMTVAELYEAAYRQAWGERRMSRLDAALRSYVVIPSTNGISREWGRIRAERRASPISVDDAWIAATARAYDLELATHNPVNFRDIRGLGLVSHQVDGD
jgi:tRNA(fMet)-specific endonuclease VapC